MAGVGKRTAGGGGVRKDGDRDGDRGGDRGGGWGGDEGSYGMGHGPGARTEPGEGRDGHARACRDRATARRTG